MTQPTHRSQPIAGERYPYKADPYSSHTLLKNYLLRAPADARILDVGTAAGTLGRLLAGTSFQLYGIEPDPQMAARAQNHYREVSISTLDETPEPFLSGYEVVVCADVLEHLPEPQQSLGRLAALQPPGSWFLISVPNVANIWVRLNLLLGRFEYSERGILDRTHLRFFTHRSFVQLVESAGLAIQTIDVTPIPLGLVNPFFEQTRFGRGCSFVLDKLTVIFPGLLAYQYFCWAVKPSSQES